MKDDILLSICIPVYNGGLFFEFNLKKIFHQIKLSNIKGVQVLVSDNCSTDGTLSVIKKYKEKYPNIFDYLVNKKNLGSDYNEIKLIKHAKGKFIHLMGADDWYASCGIRRILELIENNKQISLIVLGNCFFRQSVKEYVLRNNLNKKFYVKDKLYNDKDEFFVDQEDRIWPLTNLVLKREYLLQIGDLSSFVGKDWIHIYFVLCVLASNSNAIITSDSKPIVINRVDVQSWLNRVDGPRIYLNHLIIINKMLKIGFKEKTYKEYVNWYLKNRLYNMKFTRPKGFVKKMKFLYCYFLLSKNVPIFYLKFIRKFLF